MRTVLIKPALAAALVAVLALVPFRAEGQSPEILCNVGTVVSPQWVACSGAWSGNDIGGTNLATTLERIQTKSAWQYYDLGAFESAFAVVAAWGVDPNHLPTTPEHYPNYIGTTGEANDPFNGFSEGYTASVTFKNPYTGVFVLILKGGPPFGNGGYYMYLLDFRDSVQEPIEIRIAGGGEGGVNGYEISHLSLWGEHTTTVPEPSTLLLLGSGLLGVGFLGYRRRRM